MGTTLRDTGRFDVFISHSGTEYGYSLAEKDGVLQYFPGFVEETAQQQTQGEFSYSALPNTVSSILAFENWSEGAGLYDAPAGTSTTKRYSYSRGVDASWGAFAILSPERQSFTGLTTALTKIVVASTGTFAIGGRYLYKLTGTVWAVSRDAGAGEAFTDLIEYNNGTSVFLIGAQGDADDLSYSTNGGSTWSAAAGMQFTYLTVRGSSSTVPVLWGVTAAGLLKSSTNVTAFSNVDRVAGTGGTVNALMTANNLIWVFRTDGVSYYDGTSTQAFLPLPGLVNALNGTNPYMWIDGKIYVGYGSRLIAIDPVAFTFETVFLPQHPELNGTITAISGDTIHLYYALKNSDGNTYVMKQNPSLGDPHTWAYLGANNCTALVVLAAGGPHSTNPVLAGSYGTGGLYFVLPRVGLSPLLDSAYLFDTAGGTLYGPWVDGGALSIPDSLHATRIVAESLSGSRTATVSYGTDGDDATLTASVVAVEDGLSTLKFTPVEFARVRYSLALATPDNLHSPHVHGVALDTIPVIPRHRQWSMVLDLGDADVPRSGGTQGKQGFRALYDHLYGGVSSGGHITYVDYFGTEYVAKIRSIDGAGLARRSTGKGRNAVSMNVQLVVAEIQQSSNPSGTFVWGNSVWGEGDTYG